VSEGVSGPGAEHVDRNALIRATGEHHSHATGPHCDTKAANGPVRGPHGLRLNRVSSDLRG